MFFDMKKLLDLGMGALAIGGGIMFYIEGKNPWWLVYAAACVIITLYSLSKKD